MTDLYRFYDKSQRLLYVGISLSAAQRASDHKATKPWWPEVATMTVERISDDRDEARKIERAAIEGERPKYNIVHNRLLFKARPNAVWACQFCRGPADYIQADVNGGIQITEWFCNCKSCDPLNDTHYPYWFRTSDITTFEDHYDLEKHLNRKRWMDWGHWDAMVDDCRISLVPDEFRVQWAERYPHRWREELPHMPPQRYAGQPLDDLILDSLAAGKGTTV
jgi:hypothetical protein